MSWCSQSCNRILAEINTVNLSAYKLLSPTCFVNELEMQIPDRVTVVYFFFLPFLPPPPPPCFCKYLSNSLMICSGREPFRSFNTWQATTLTPASSTHLYSSPSCLRLDFPPHSMTSTSCLSSRAVKRCQSDYCGPPKVT